MKYFIVSDVHGFYDELQAALNENQFNPEEDTLISCGDLLDRGPDPERLLTFVTNLPHKILIEGNHEMLLKDLIKRQNYYDHDIHNGTLQTVLDLEHDTTSKALYSIARNKLLRTYFDLLVPYYETDHHIFVHSWIPDQTSNWRHGDWYSAAWNNPFSSLHNPTNKTIVHGHWHNSKWWSEHTRTPEWGPEANFSIVRDTITNQIGLDTCTVYTHKVNVLVLNEDEI